MSNILNPPSKNHNVVRASSLKKKYRQMYDCLKDFFCATDDTIDGYIRVFSDKTGKSYDVEFYTEQRYFIISVIPSGWFATYYDIQGRAKDMADDRGFKKKSWVYFKKEFMGCVITNVK